MLYLEIFQISRFRKRESDGRWEKVAKLTRMLTFRPSLYYYFTSPQSLRSNNTLYFHNFTNFDNQEGEKRRGFDYLSIFKKPYFYQFKGGI